MSLPFMIQSAIGALTIDIRQAVYAEGTGILGYPPGGGGAKPIQPNQSWQAVADPLGSGHYLIVSGACNLCIGIGANVPLNANVTDDATDRGVTLTLQVQEPVNNHYQLWDFVPPTGGAGNTVFIQNPQTGYVMELQSQSTVACPLVVNPRRISNESYQLWTAVDQTGGAVALPVVAMAQPGSL
jgi:Ricin-type beta-trefoil lectin domain-like